eukprot:5338880-Pyramimonas_sp.AAC.1
MVNLTPAPRNAFLPRALPATCFGPCENIPDALWVYQSGKVVPKVNIQTAGLTQDELVIVKASWDEYETPIAAMPPPQASLFDAAAVDFPEHDHAGNRAPGGPVPASAVLPDE